MNQNQTYEHHRTRNSFVNEAKLPILDMKQGKIGSKGFSEEQNKTYFKAYMDAINLNSNIKTEVK